MRASSASHRLGPQTVILEIRSAIGLGFGAAIEVAFSASLVAQAVAN